MWRWTNGRPSGSPVDRPRVLGTGSAVRSGRSCCCSKRVVALYVPGRIPAACALIMTTVAAVLAGRARSVCEACCVMGVTGCSGSSTGSLPWSGGSRITSTAVRFSDEQVGRAQGPFRPLADRVPLPPSVFLPHRVKSQARPSHRARRAAPSPRAHRCRWGRRSR